jgi:glycosyltransferase involved in cell wall biosynthesis
MNKTLPGAPSGPPRFSVIVSSYNYEDFVVAAVNSALQQSLPPLEVIVVDDGSSDTSVPRLQTAFDKEPRVKIIPKDNGGQMSAWVEGCRHANGDVVALLDSDDLWHPQYLQQIAKVYIAQPSVDYVYCNMEKFGASQGLMLTRKRHRHSRDLGLSVLMGACVQRWQGVATSGNTLRRTLLERILALPTEQIAEWKSRPDDCLFYGSDILGAHKYYLAEALALHREHPQNALLEFKRSPVKNARYALRLERMLEHYRHATGFTESWLKLAKYEFRTKPQPSWSECWMYAGFAMQAPTRLSSRLSQVGSILSHYLKTR